MTQKETVRSVYENAIFSYINACQAENKCNKAEWDKHASELCVQYPTIYLNTHMYTCIYENYL